MSNYSAISKKPVMFNGQRFERVKDAAASIGFGKENNKEFYNQYVYSGQVGYIQPNGSITYKTKNISNNSSNGPGGYNTTPNVQTAQKPTQNVQINKVAEINVNKIIDDIVNLKIENKELKSQIDYFRMLADTNPDQLISMLRPQQDYQEDYPDYEY